MRAGVLDLGVRGVRRRDSTASVLRAVLSTCCAAGEWRRERGSRSRPHCGFPSSAFASWLLALLDAPALLSSTWRKASARWAEQVVMARRGDRVPVVAVAGVGKGRVGESGQVSAVTGMVTVDHIWSSAHRQSRVSGASAKRLPSDLFARRVTPFRASRRRSGWTAVAATSAMPAPIPHPG
ncbi:MAG: hypothetical protein AW10_00533 [Candidatus Accumulibacter appositus]|uniref:Uncharacterized protein n=1 Tax=Candidatus Accumulibacter appositus TaxID=1454003 RepID=A0A011P4A8_9PROT|nr:MAG: hypothetical protein AW10_00533 [Candidatus Accumulibacter appositus]